MGHLVMSSVDLRMRRGCVSKRATLAPNERKKEPRQSPHAAPSSSSGDGGGGSLKNERAALRQVPLRDTSEQARRRCRQRQRRRRQLSASKVSATARICTSEHVSVYVSACVCVCVRGATDNDGCLRHYRSRSLPRERVSE